VNQLQYLLAQFGDRKKRSLSISMLLDVQDFPFGDWTIVGQRVSRAGFFQGNNVVYRRTREAGGYLAWRSWRLEEPRRGLWHQIIPYALVEDAERAVPLQVEMGSKNRAEVVVNESKILEGLSIPGTDTSWVCESYTTTQKGPGVSRYVVGNVGRFVFMLAASARGEGWPMEEVASLASLQANRIRAVLEDSGSVAG
jgi:hypothetical protein